VQNSIPNHPFQLHLTANGVTHRIGKLPLFESIGYGIGVNHDALGLQQHGGYTYTTLWDHTLTANLYATNIKLGNKDYAYKTYYFNGSYTKTYDWFSMPHWQVFDTTNATLSRQFNSALMAYAGYSVVHTGDYYRSGGWSQPLNPPIVNGVPVYSLLAFRGVSTLRTASLGATYTTNPNFVATVVYQHHQDFPIAYPGLFPQAPTNNLGTPIYQNYLGQAPNNITGDVRFLAMPHVALDVSREYFFNFGTQRWAPSFTIQVIGQ
jgi:hypothetical protein